MKWISRLTLVVLLCSLLVACAGITPTPAPSTTLPPLSSTSTTNDYPPQPLVIFSPSELEAINQISGLQEVRLDYRIPIVLSALLNNSAVKIFASEDNSNELAFKVNAVFSNLYSSGWVKNSEHGVRVQVFTGGAANIQLLFGVLPTYPNLGTCLEELNLPGLSQLEPAMLLDRSGGKKSLVFFVSGPGVNEFIASPF